MSTDKKKVKRSLTDAGDSGEWTQWTSNSEKKSKVAVIQELDELDAPAPVSNTDEPIPWNTEQESKNLEWKQSQPPADTPGNAIIDDPKLTTNTSDPPVKNSYMTPSWLPTTSSKTAAVSSTHSTTAPPTNDTPTWAISILALLKDLRLDVSSLKQELCDIKQNFL